MENNNEAKKMLSRRELPTRAARTSNPYSQTKDSGKKKVSVTQDSKTKAKKPVSKKMSPKSTAKKGKKIIISEEDAKLLEKLKADEMKKAVERKQKTNEKRKARQEARKLRKQEKKQKVNHFNKLLLEKLDFKFFFETSSAKDIEEWLEIESTKKPFDDKMKAMISKLKNSATKAKEWREVGVRLLSEHYQDEVPEMYREVVAGIKKNGGKSANDKGATTKSERADDKPPSTNLIANEDKIVDEKTANNTTASTESKTANGNPPSTDSTGNKGKHGEGNQEPKKVTFGENKVHTLS